MGNRGDWDGNEKGSEIRIARGKNNWACVIKETFGFRKGHIVESLNVIL